MNERLKELIKQAGLDDDMFPLDDGWENPELTKFAELIVRECAAVVFRKTGPKSALDVLEHFGVEE